MTIGALCYGVYQLKTGNSLMANYMMRLRIAGQAFTIAAILIGTYGFSGLKDLPVTRPNKKE